MPSPRSPAPDTTGDVDAIAHAQQVVVFALATLAEQRESDSENHLLRVQAYVRALAQTLRGQPAFATLLSDAYIDLLCRSVPLYDMGSIGIPDRILLKPGPLTPDEMTLMRTHPTIGYAAIGRAEQTLGRVSPLLLVAKELALSHHEKWDGSGYPQGLAATQIPVAARIMAIADVYDALISDKVYKDGVPHDRAVQVIFGERGAHFDPDMVDAFIEIQDTFQRIAQQYADTEADMRHRMEYMASSIADHAEL